jgi:predicted TIM-barrel fold metal-dependent hydrolase
VRVAPYPEDDIPRIVGELDDDDRVLVFGSDFPHPEGVVAPADFEALLDSLGDDVKARIMRENANAIFDAAP